MDGVGERSVGDPKEPEVGDWNTRDGDIAGGAGDGDGQGEAALTSKSGDDPAFVAGPLLWVMRPSGGRSSPGEAAGEEFKIGTGPPW